MDKAKIDTKDEGTQFCAIPGPRGFKWPSLGELHHALFNKGFDDAHDAAADVEAILNIEKKYLWTVFFYMKTCLIDF